MAKVMLVEDDNNLREIYEARLAAEGYQIISAPDGEAALALAIKEKPDLIVSDIMMPKVSGFDMLDILRSTTETKNAKIIMMTALGQAEDKARAEKLGADRYLVKSQVTLEDVVKAAQELLGDQNPTNVGGVAVEQPAVTPAPAPTTPLTPAPTVPVPPTPAPTAIPAPAAAPAPTPPAPIASPTPQSIPVTVAEPTTAPAAPTPPPNPTPVTPAPAPAPTAAATTPPTMAAPPSDAQKTLDAAATTLSPEDAPSGERVIVKSDANTPPAPTADVPSAPAGQRKKVINPISDVLTKGPDLNALLAKEGETLDDTDSPGQPGQTDSTVVPPAPEPAPTPVPPASETPGIVPPAPQVPLPTPATSTPVAPGTIPETSTTAEEEAALQNKIEEFITTQNPSISTSPINDVKPPDAPKPAA